MRKSVFYNTKRQMPFADIGSELKLVEKVINCAGKAVSDGEFLYQPLSNGTIKVINLSNFECDKEINLKSFKEISKEKSDFAGTYLLINENYLIVQIDENVFLYDLITEKLAHLLTEDGIFVIYKSFLENDKLFISSYVKDGINNLSLFNVKTAKRVWENVMNSQPKFVLFDEGKIFLTDNSNIVCRSIADGTIIWKTEVASQLR